MKKLSIPNINFVQWLHVVSNVMISNVNFGCFGFRKGVGCGSFYYETINMIEGCKEAELVLLDMAIWNGYSTKP